MTSAEHDRPTTSRGLPEGFSHLDVPVFGTGRGVVRPVARIVVCDDCGCLVGNTVAHRVLCFREERDS